MKRKTRREKEVMTDPESKKEFRSHEKSTNEPHPGKKMKEMGNHRSPRTSKQKDTTPLHNHQPIR